MNHKHNEYLVDQEIAVKMKLITHYACRMTLNGHWSGKRSDLR